MKNKPKDQLYCGVDKEKIKKSNPILNEENFEHLLTWIEERYSVHVKKDVEEQSAPWTNNPIIGNYRFTNVRREHDKVTKWYIENIALSDKLSYHEKVLNTFLFRAWNKIETIEIFGGPFNEDSLFDVESARELYHNHRKKNPKYVWFTPAFNTGGLKRAYKYLDKYSYNLTEKEASKDQDYEKDIPVRMFSVSYFIEKNDIFSKIESSQTQEEAFKAIKEVHGFGGFLAYQVFVDLAYIPEFQFSENEFTIAGPGCQRGLKNIFEDFDGLSYEEAIFWIRDYINKKKPNGFNPKKVFHDLSKEDRCMNVMSLENCFCEISKYIKAKNETGRPRQRYIPRKELSARNVLF